MEHHRHLLGLFHVQQTTTTRSHRTTRSGSHMQIVTCATSVSTQPDAKLQCTTLHDTTAQSCPCAACPSIDSIDLKHPYGVRICTVWSRWNFGSTRITLAPRFLTRLESQQTDRSPNERYFRFALLTILSLCSASDPMLPSHSQRQQCLNTRACPQVKHHCCATLPTA
jgi:hypothetical protein